jgi:hypothetical protein
MTVVASGTLCLAGDSLGSGESTVDFESLIRMMIDADTAPLEGQRSPRFELIN